MQQQCVPRTAEFRIGKKKQKSGKNSYLVYDKRCAAVWYDDTLYESRLNTSARVKASVWDYCYSSSCAWLSPPAHLVADRRWQTSALPRARSVSSPWHQIALASGCPLSSAPLRLFRLGRYKVTNPSPLCPTQGYFFRSPPHSTQKKIGFRRCCATILSHRAYDAKAPAWCSPNTGIKARSCINFCLRAISACLHYVVCSTGKKWCTSRSTPIDRFGRLLVYLSLRSVPQTPHRRAV